MNGNVLKMQLIRRFPNGISYSEASNICLAIFCSTDWIPDILSEECSKENLAKTFSELAKSGMITDFISSDAEKLNSECYPITESTHWIYIIELAMKTGVFYEKSIVDKLLAKA